MKFIIAILIFSGIVMFHELGHFLLAKWNGIRVNEFCLGLGPTIVGFQRGETKYSLKLLPFGGACMMEGEDGESKDGRAFGNKSVPRRISVVAAGPIFNFILAFLLSVIMIACIGYDKPVVYDVMPGYSAAEVGIEPGDTILKMGNKRIHFYREITNYTFFHPKETTIPVEYERDGVKYEKELELTYDSESGRYLMGLLGSGSYEKPGVLGTLQYSAYTVSYWIDTTVQSLKMLVTGRVSPNDLSGPVGIVKSIGDTYDQSVQDGYFYVFINMLNIAILLSANLGVMNLLPIPALDGGRLVFLVVEGIRRKKVDENKEGMVHFISFIILIALMVLVMFNDVRKLFIGF